MMCTNSNSRVDEVLLRPHAVLAKDEERVAMLVAFGRFYACLPIAHHGPSQLVIHFSGQRQRMGAVLCDMVGTQGRALRAGLSVALNAVSARVCHKRVGAYTSRHSRKCTICVVGGLGEESPLSFPYKAGDVICLLSHKGRKKRTRAHLQKAKVKINLKRW